ncbi:hypothetical protein HMPREF0731_0550 [Pseudoroseomonas cervicalis ATCC 49957]|uniref:Uncharacterized protein n=1 Tax=Pseudoroseomonas cervicalis ATCC 49957 TaxID=525371 RepID=D5RHJ1_9PROT|nr:hypothetical protein HMPREF0731_0550 [Pseudoroseomonas cervicalis ATCC 49957]
MRVRAPLLWRRRAIAQKPRGPPEGSGGPRAVLGDREDAAGRNSPGDGACLTPRQAPRQ